MQAVTSQDVADIDRSVRELSTMPAFLEAALGRVPPHSMALRPEGEEFAMVEQACHLRDVEREGFLLRARRLLAEKDPVLQPFFGDVVARERNYLAQDARSAARDFTLARRELVAIFAAASPADFARSGTFAGEPLCLRELLGMVAAHDREHRGQIDALLRRLAAP